MAPCPPASVQMADDAATKSVDNDSSNPGATTDEKALEKKSSSGMMGLPKYTMHWEMNLVTAMVLGAIYASIPAEYVNYFYGFLLIIAVDAIRYYQFRGSMAGNVYTLPMVTIVSMIIWPVRFWREQAMLAIESGEGLSTNLLGGKRMVFVTDAKKCREIFTGEGTYQLFAHPNALWLFGPSNLIYMDTEPHKRFRALLTPALFSNDSLTLYARAQEKIVRKYMDNIVRQCADGTQTTDVRISFRSMAAAASQESFMGPYLSDELRKRLEIDILEFTNGFLCFPFPYLNSGLHQAIKAKHRIEKTIAEMMPSARAYMKAGNKPRCLLEYWALAIQQAADEQGVEPTEVNGCSDVELGMTVMDFLFAAQDATNSALTFALDVLATRPDVVSKIRAELAKTPDKPIWSMVVDPDNLVYTCKASNQMLHHKPPVPMVPHLVLKDAYLGGRFMPKGTVVIPSIAYTAQHNGTSAEYIVERETDADPQFIKTPVFGGGQHKCPGRRYAESLLTVFLAVLCQDCDWERIGKRPGVDEIMYFPTLFPSENDFILRKRKEVKTE